jgi:5-methylcytosine-specific restriction endonuclease McrA
MVVYARTNGTTPLYLVAGSDAAAMGADKALRAAYQLHGGVCFYCKKKIGEGQLTIDHAQPAAIKPIKDIQNLVIACRPCNLEKGAKPIEFFNAEAGREWLSAVLAQVHERLNRL